MRARQAAIERRMSCCFLACVLTAPSFQPVSPSPPPFELRRWRNPAVLISPRLLT
jgi:hypothetical protein